ncbi:hypothetical protein B9Z55_007709 [Caenorhabditis nigoni]|uniref:BTB domain-containing protein n=2 Tax=Caenorhabditis nigoni TaxID=1611254 RepID=A0A2G5VAW8_9PELO|nr:hypothetical protein B9Z55_007709 [Caenorhabditis nigoni]
MGRNKNRLRRSREDCLRLHSALSNLSINIETEPDSAIVPENMKSVEKLMLAETEKIRNHHEQKFNALSARLQSIEASIQKSKDVSEKEPINESTVPTNNTTNVASKTVKRFQLKHVFKDVASFVQNKWHYSTWVEHYNVKWQMSVVHCNGHLRFLVYCDPIAPKGKWSIRTELEFKVVGGNRNVVIRTWDFVYGEYGDFGFQKFQDWEQMKKWYLVDGNLTVEAKVTIVETTGLAKPKVRKFDESQKDISDVIMVVRDTKFYVSKMFLASQSSVFKALLFGNFSESKQSEVTLNGIDPDDFHYFLEVLYGESAVDDMNVEDVALLADMYDAPTAIRKCEEFLLKESKKKVEMKLEIATRYHLEKLEKKCMSEIKDKVPKEMFVTGRNNHLVFAVFCVPIAPADKWSIRTKLEYKVVGPNQNDIIRTWDFCHKNNGGFSFQKFQDWEEMEKWYLVDGNLTVEAKVTIVETTGLRREKIRKFDESQKDISDCIMKVRDTKFYVSKTVRNRYANVEDIALLADMYDTPTAIRKWEEFLLRESKKAVENKLEIATQYNLENLKEWCKSQTP